MDRFDQPIPDMTEARMESKNARTHPVNMNAPENNERGFDAREYGIAGENYYHREDNPPYLHRAPHAIPELYVREGVLKRLIGINESLKSRGYELYLFDAYRPVEVQNYFFDHWVPQYLHEEHPQWNAERIASETTRYWAKGAPSSDAVDPLSPPPHLTGGVLDLTLRKYGSNTLLPMGTPFDDATPMSAIEYFEQQDLIRPFTLRDEEARANRRMLFWTMVEAGFTNYPNEWWHYGRGDQLSAKLSNQPHAVYSALIIDR